MAKTPVFTCLKFTRVYIMSSIDIKTKMTQTRIALLVICHIARAIGQEQQTHAKWWQRYDVLVVGAGLSGAVLAERHAAQGDRVLVIDKRPHIAGNCYDYVDEPTGIRVSKYGAHLFHTNIARVWRYVQQFADWRRWDHTVLAYVDGQHVPVPVNVNTVNQMFNASLRDTGEMDAFLSQLQVKYESAPANSEEMAKSRVGEVLYDKIFGPYTRKQWNRPPAELAPEVTGRIPVRNDFDNRYFTDRYQALPVQGYTEFVANLLHGADVLLGVDYFDLNNTSSFKGVTYYTGPIDRFFGQGEQLEYRSLLFERVAVMNHVGTVQPVSVINYPSADYEYTRIIEYKHFLRQQSPHTVLFREYPSDIGEPYYPVPSKRNMDLYESLRMRAGEIPNVIFVGRLASYKYINMDQAIDDALSVFERDGQRLKIEF